MNQKLYPHPFFAREGWPFIGGTLIVALLVQLFAGGCFSVIPAVNRRRIPRLL